MKENQISAFQSYSQLLQQVDTRYYGSTKGKVLNSAKKDKKDFPRETRLEVIPE